MTNLKNEYFAEQINGKLVSISHHGIAVQVELVETGQTIPNATDVMIYNYHDLLADITLSHWYEPEQRYYMEIATCKAQFA